MLRDRAVRGLKFCRAVRRDEHGGHHGERAERCGHHIAHHVAVIILAGPDEAALAMLMTRNGVVDQRVEIPQAKRLELRPIALLVFFFKNALERAVIDLGNGILGGEPEILLRINGILEAGPRERADAAFLIVFALEDGGAVGFLDENGLLPAGCALEGHGAFAGLVRLKAYGLIHVAVGMAGDRDRLFPCAHDRLDRVQQNGRTEDRAVQNGTDGPVRAFPHLGQLRIFGHSLRVRRDRRAFDGHAVFSGRQRRVDRDLIARLVAVQQAEIVILGLEVDKRAD